MIPVPSPRGTLGGLAHGCRSKQIFGVCKGFLPKFSQKVVVQFCRPFFGVTSRKWSLLVFLQTLGAIVEVKQGWESFLSRLSGILPMILPNECPVISDLAIHRLLAFCATYLFQAAFPKLIIIKFKKRSFLKNVESVLRPALSHINLRMDDLCKNHQVLPSL